MSYGSSYVLDRGPRDFQGPVNVRRFGAIGDGVTDDTAALQAAIDQFEDTGGTVYLPKGIYSISSPLLIGESGNPSQGIVLESESRSKAYTGGTLLRWIGDVNAGPVIHARNAATGAMRNVGIDCNARANYGLQLEHVQGDTDTLRAWEISGCHFSEARTFNVLIGDEDELTYGDNSCATFYHCYFGATFSAAETSAHVRQLAGETFSTAFYNCQFTGHPTLLYPARGIAIQAGTADVHSGLFETLSEADIYLDARSGRPIPAVNVYGAHSQSATFLKCATAGTGANSAQQASVLSGVYHADIVAPTSQNSIYWDVGSHGSLTLSGVRTHGDIEIASATAKVFSNGVYFDDVSGNWSGVGAGRVNGTWWKASRYYTRHPDLLTYADDTAATSGGVLAAGDLYKTSAGVVMVKL